MDLIYKFIEKSLAYEGNFLKMRSDKIELPNKKQSTMEFIEHPGAACILAIDKDDKVLMVRQYRYPISRVTYEIPAGKLDFDEKFIDCANRELEEETGYRAKCLELLSIITPIPAYSTEVIYVYLASDLYKGSVNLDDDEFLTCEKVELEKVMDLILNNKITDAKTQIAILKYILLKGNRDDQ